MLKLIFGKFLFSATLILTFPLFLVGQKADTTAHPSVGVFDLLARHEIAKVTLTTDLTEILTNKRLVEYLDGEFTFPQTDEVDMTLPVRIRVRGRFRRMRCDFPPLKLKFRKDDLAAHSLNEFNELKLVTHCLGNAEESKELIFKEYLTYRLFNIVCKESFRAQLARVTYLNTEKKPKKVKGWGILIEDSDELAYRMAGIKLDSMGMPDSCFNINQESVTAMFQFMIGNTDWNCLMNRNIEQILMPDSTVHVIPYDFDFSGLVAAPYATPRREIGQSTLQHRVFQGKTRTLDNLRPVIQHFLAKKEAILAEVEQFDSLSSKTKKEVLEYLESFFKIIENDELAQVALFPPPAVDEEPKPKE